MSVATKVRELPILFSGEMVRAILDGRKTQTRRVVTQRLDDRRPHHIIPSGRAEHEWLLRFGSRPLIDELYARSPYGQPGDRLYVRETWAGLIPGGNFDEINGPPSVMPRHVEVRYKATDRLADTDIDVRGYRWRPSIHLPKALARIWLEVTGVRVERVQEISEEDAIAEGIQQEDLGPDPDNFHPPGSYGFVSGLDPFPKGHIHPSPVEAFHELWDSINARRAPWSDNPWVWCVSFRMIEP